MIIGWDLVINDADGSGSRVGRWAYHMVDAAGNPSGDTGNESIWALMELQEGGVSVNQWPLYD